MLRRLFPLFLGVGGLAVGLGAGLYLKPEPEAHDPSADQAHDTEGVDEHASDVGQAGADGSHSDSEGSGPEYVKLNNQFVVPVVREGRVSAMVVLSLSLEVEPGTTEVVYQREPKLRDVFLQVLFDHANIGGFSGSFTDGSNLVVLRTGLKEAAALVLGPAVRDVLITDIARQDS